MAKRLAGLAGLLLCTALATSALATPQANSQTKPADITNVSVRLKTLKLSDVLLSGANLKIAGHGLPTQSLWLKPVQDAWIISARDRNPVRIASSDLQVVAQAMTVDNESVPENTSLSARGSKIDVIAHLDLETYLLGVLPAEMPSGWPLEALKAQAIAARTFAMRKVQERGERSFQLDSTVSDQMYRYKEPSAAITQAVNETRGQILTDSQGEPIEAYFHADCGGQTETASNVWTTVQAHSQKTTRDESCRLSSRKWSYQIETRELYRKLSSVLNLPDDGEFVALKIKDHTDSGRVKSLALTYRDHRGENLDRLITGQLYRSAIGFDRVKSTLFGISFQSGTVLMAGRGSGHGVGLCQQGAKAWAQRGLKASEILAHYYPTSNLTVVR